MIKKEKTPDSTGYKQERFDPTHSSYSYEDLPSYRFGATFAMRFFNPDSNATLVQQIQAYLNNVFGATVLTDAPNYQTMPTIDSKNPPSRTNKTTKPKYTQE